MEKIEKVYNEYIESHNQKVMLSKLKKSELIELLVYAQDENDMEIMKWEKYYLLDYLTDSMISIVKLVEDEKYAK